MKKITKINIFFWKFTISMSDLGFAFLLTLKCSLTSAWRACAQGFREMLTKVRKVSGLSYNTLRGSFQ